MEVLVSQSLSSVSWYGTYPLSIMLELMAWQYIACCGVIGKEVFILVGTKRAFKEKWSCPSLILWES